MGAVRVALLFGSAAVALAVLLTPLADSQTRSRMARASVPANIDLISTGTTIRKDGYIIRRSVLQNSPQSVCIIRDNGTRSGDC
jgi:hypothetical protein